MSLTDAQWIARIAQQLDERPRLAIVDELEMRQARIEELGRLCADKAGVVHALRRLVDAIKAYDDEEPDTCDELDAAETFAVAVLAQHEPPPPTQEALGLEVVA